MRCLCLLCLIILYSTSLSALDRKVINSNNISDFEVISGLATCYKGDIFGVISKSPLEVGVIFTEVNKKSLSKRIKKLNQKIKKAKKNKRQNLRNQKKSLSEVRKNFASLIELCGGSSSPDGEFSGNPNSLSAYHENLTENEVTHLLNKVAFGGTPELIQIGKRDGLTALVNALVDGTMSNSERSSFENNVSKIAQEFSWYESEDLSGKQVWTTEAVVMSEYFRMIYSPEPLREWMSLLLSTHFAVNLYRIGFSYNTYEHKGLPEHVALIRNNALGSFADIAYGILWDPAMNVWLDNRDNRADSPNQNFARELLELFLLGTEDPITRVPNYNEESVVAVTAYVSGFYQTEITDPEHGNTITEIAFSEDDHDYQSYSVFGGISGAEFAGNMLPEEFVSYILYSHSGAPRYIAERFAGKILYPGLSEQVVASLANLLIENNYNLAPFLKRVLKSQAMFSENSRNACISNPIEHFVKLAKQVYPVISDNLSPEQLENLYYLLYNLSEATSSSGQELFGPPSVFAWKGECNINRSGVVAKGEGWMTMQKLVGRLRGCGDMLSTLIWRDVDLVERLNLQNATTPNEILNTISNSLNLKTPTGAVREALIQYLKTELDDDGNRYEREPDLSEDWYVFRKVPRTVCLLSNLPEFYMK